MVDVAGNNVPSSISKDGWSAGGGTGGGECGAADEADTLSEAGAGGDKLEGTDSTQDDALHLERRVGLFSGVALIVGTMIGKCSLCRALLVGLVRTWGREPNFNLCSSPNSNSFLCDY